MATHDYVIDNSTGANVRADINLVLQAILTNNSSSSAPSTTAAYMWWADTTNGVLKIRNSSNNDWVELLQLDGTLTLEDGSASTPGLAFRDDLNTGIFSSAADTFNVATAGVERMELGATTIFNEDGADVDFRIEGDTNANLFYVDAGNNRVGIGTASPNTLLELSGGGNTTLTVNTGNNSGDNSQIAFGDSADADVGFINYDHGTNAMQFRVNASEAFRLNSSGTLLIGTTTGALADGNGIVIADATSARISLKDSTNGVTGTDGFDLVQTGVNAFLFHREDGDMVFGTNATERMRIDSSGRLLIGTTSSKTLDNADCSLQVIGSNFSNSGFTQQRYVNSVSGPSLLFAKSRSGTIGTQTIVQNGDELGKIRFYGSDGNDFDNYAAEIKANVDATPGSNDMPGRLVFLTTSDGAAAPTERMRIDSSGRLLIGTTTEGDGGADDLTVATSGNTGITIRTGTSNNGSLFFSDATSGAAEYAGFVQYVHSEDAMIFGTASTERMRIRSGGTIGMGASTTANARLFVNPNVDGSTQRGITISGRRDVYDVIAINFVHATTNASAGSIQFTSTAAVQYNTTSDYRLKQDIVTLTDSITKLKQLNPVHFKWKDSPSVETDGFLAHEVQTIVPSAITGEKDALDKDGNIEPQQIDIGKLTPLLTSALQEAIAKIETLETKVAALEAA